MELSRPSGSVSYCLATLNKLFHVAKFLLSHREMGVLMVLPHEVLEKG